MISEKQKGNKDDHNSPASLEEEFGISYAELSEAYEEFVKEEPEHPRNRGLVNFATVTGVAMLVVAAFAFLQMMGIQFGPDISLMMHVMPLIGAFLALMLGLGWFSSRKRRKTKKKSAAKGDVPEFKIKQDAPPSLNAKTAEGFDEYAFEKKRLRKSRKNKKIAGVCGGIANYFGFDPTIVRIAFALSAIFYGSTIFVYLILAIILEKEPKP